MQCMVMVPLHSILGDRTRLHLKQTNKKKATFFPLYDYKRNDYQIATSCIMVSMLAGHSWLG